MEATVLETAASRRSASVSCSGNEEEVIGPVCRQELLAVCWEFERTKTNSHVTSIHLDVKEAGAETQNVHTSARSAQLIGSLLQEAA